jgi:hypothetical protein
MKTRLLFTLALLIAFAESGVSQALPSAPEAKSGTFFNKTNVSLIVIAGGGHAFSAMEHNGYNDDVIGSGIRSQLTDYQRHDSYSYLKEYGQQSAFILGAWLAHDKGHARISRFLLISDAAFSFGQGFYWLRAYQHSGCRLNHYDCPGK